MSNSQQRVAMFQGNTHRTPRSPNSTLAPLEKKAGAHSGFNSTPQFSIRAPACVILIEPLRITFHMHPGICIF